MILTAAASGAPVLLVDEPSAGASPGEAARIGAVLLALRDEGRALLVVEHNVGLVGRIADRVLTIDGGRIVDTAT
jgi:ABC-type branched-subunit amino acid transport system ATPase component